MLEEVGLPYRVHPIDIGKGHQFHPDFLAISPNNKIPAIIDTDNGLRLMESGAILLYLAEKTGKLWPQDFPTKWRVVEWLMWQMGGPGPFLGQVHHKPSRSTTIPMSNAGTWRSRRGRRCKGRGMCPPVIAAFLCLE